MPKPERRPKPQRQPQDYWVKGEWKGKEAYTMRKRIWSKDGTEEGAKKEFERQFPTYKATKASPVNDDKDGR